MGHPVVETFAYMPTLDNYFKMIIYFDDKYNLLAKTICVPLASFYPHNCRGIQINHPDMHHKVQQTHLQADSLTTHFLPTVNKEKGGGGGDVTNSCDIHYM